MRSPYVAQARRNRKPKGWLVLWYLALWPLLSLVVYFVASAAVSGWVARSVVILIFTGCRREFTRKAHPAAWALTAAGASAHAVSCSA